MPIKQISVFLENNAGRLAEVTEVLARADINLRAIAIADTADFGILRLIVDKEAEAVQALTGAGFTTRETQVAAVEIDDTPGGLAGVMKIFKEYNINIEYLYASLEHKSGKAVVVFRLEDIERGIAIIKEKGLSMIEKF
ncbi:MAG: amino acid-binding protein [Treponema sp.]|jgi:hypothetical protein|nr:amino acid-binding protein [Treponema sp.]